MITFSDFHFSYNRKKPLYSNLNLELPSGKIYGLFGKNGAGKSTLLKNITGLNSPTKGNITVNNQTPRKRKPSFLSSIYLIPEEVYIPSISPGNYVKTYGGFYPHFSIEEFEAHIKELQVPETRNLTKLSFGQQKKFIIAFALACNTQTLIMDEPTNGLDIPSKSQFRKLMASTITDEKTFIISTHQVRDLDHILDHILIVNNGNIRINASINEIVDRVAFNYYPTRPNHEGILTVEESVEGFSVMEKNTDNVETEINIEQFFNAAIEADSELQQLF